MIIVEDSNGEIRGMYPPGEHTLIATDANDQEHKLIIEPSADHEAVVYVPFPPTRPQ